MSRQSDAARIALRILIVEDREDDLLLLLSHLERAYRVTHERVQTEVALRAAVHDPLGWDLVISDFSLPTMNALDVLRVIGSEAPDLPCIVMSGTIAEESAVDVLRAGARDFVVKERMTRLLPAIARELREGQERKRRREAEESLRETRERMEFALDSVGMGTWESDLRTGRTVWSRILERLHGMEPGTFEETQDAFLAAIHPDDRARVRERIEHPSPADSDARIEYRTQWPDGSIHWIASIGRAFFDARGIPLRAVGIGMDITAAKQLEEQLRQAQRMESIGNLAGGIAHDFNNLLTVIIGSCDLMAPEVESHPEAAEPLDEIRTAATSASALTRQLLMFSRRQVVTPRLLDLNETITGFGKVLRRLVEENVALDFQLAPRLPPVRIDPAEIEQVLLNLVANARDAMPHGGTITVATGTSTAPGHGDRSGGTELRVILSVSDTGQGIPDHVKERLFEPFFTTKPVGRGTGLGLPTIAGIVKHNGGEIQVWSEVGAGAKFAILLPAVSSAEGTAPTWEPEGEGDLAGTETVLVVEDDASLRRLNERILLSYGYTVLLAGDGEQARKICLEYSSPIHAVLLDVIMPGESGPVVAEWLGEHRPDARIVLMSGYTADTMNLEQAVDGRHSFLQKPFNSTQLLRTLRGVLGAAPR